MKINAKVIQVFVLFTVLNTVLMCAFYAEKRDKEYIVLLLIGTVTLVVLCLLFSLQWGAVGTAISLSIGEAILAVSLLIRSKIFPIGEVARLLLPLFAAGLVMICVFYAVSLFSMLLAVPLSVICFAMVALSSGGVRRDDLSFLKERFV